MDIEVIESEEQLAPVLQPWRDLAVARSSAFASPDWYLAAMRQLDQGTTPVVAVARSDDGTIRGLVPLLMPTAGERPSRAFAPARRVADAFEPIAEPGLAGPVACACAKALAKRLGRRSRLELGRVMANATWWREFARAWPGRMTAVAMPPERLPYIALAGLSWEEYLGSRSRQFRNDVRRKMRSLQREHLVEIRRSEAPQEVDEDIDTLFRLHDARWRTREDSSAIADPEVRDFHRDFAVAAQRHGWLRLFLLHVDGVAVAGWYGWRVGDRYAYYQAGFDPEWSRYSVGFLLMAETVKEAVKEGAVTYDLLRGQEAFKARLATDEREAQSVTIVPSLSRARTAASTEVMARSLFRLLPADAQTSLRRLRGRIRSHGKS